MSENTQQNFFQKLFENLQTTSSLLTQNPFSMENQEKTKEFVYSWMDFHATQQKQLQDNMMENQQKFIQQYQNNLHKGLEITSSMFDAQQKWMESATSLWGK